MPNPISIAKARDDLIGPWSEDKLRLLAKYLKAYTTIMAKRKWCRNGFHYVDAFAGTGRPRARDELRYVDGSPRVALTVDPPFHSYTFIEQTPWRVQRLHALQCEFPDRQIRILQGDCNDLLIAQVIPAFHQEADRRGIVFLDPFGMNLEWSTVERIAAVGRLEIFLNIPTMALNRAGLPNDPQQLTEAHVERNNRFWGTPEWRSMFYGTVPTLFGPWEVKTKPTTAIRLAEFYAAQLKQVFPYVTEPLEITNTKGVPIYCLIFAGHNMTGAKIARSIFKRFDQVERQLPLLIA